MKRLLISMIQCPACKGDLILFDEQEQAGEIKSGSLGCIGCQSRYPIIDFIPRFVPADNYAHNFGLQWNRYRKTQLDSFSGLSISRDRFFSSSGWDADKLRGAKVLDLGCGAGRFSEVCLASGAEVFAIDFSSAVDACWQNLCSYPKFHVIQGDIYALPFKQRQFDYVYCFGVLQHTPDVKRAFMALPPQLRPGGRFSVDFYLASVLDLLWPKYWLRYFTKRMPVDRLLQVVQFMVKVLLPFSLLIGKIPYWGRKLRHVIPVTNYQGIYPLSEQQLQEWSLLDTFDMLAPAYDQPQKPDTLAKWMHEANLDDIEVFQTGLLVGRGVMKESCEQKV